MKQLILVVLIALVSVGCKDRVIWNDNGKLEESTQNREVWDSNGQMETGERKIWNREDGEAVVK